MTGSAAPRVRLRSAALRAWSWWIGELRGFLPARIRGERRQRVDADIRLERDRWLIQDRRGAQSSIDPQDGPAVTRAMDALKGRRKQARVAVAVPLSRCFARRTELPRAMLNHAGSILRSELELATPFGSGSVHWDWFTDRAGSTPGTLAITQVILKRRDTASLIDHLERVGVAVTRISVEDDGAPTKPFLPINLLRHGSGSDGEVLHLRRGRRLLTAAAVLAALAVVPAAFSRQSATLDALDGELVEAKDAVALHPGLPRAPLQALGNALQTKRTIPATDTVLDGLAAALPADCTLDHLFLDNGVVTIQGTAASLRTLERSLAAAPLFSAGHNTAEPSQGADRAPFTIRLKLKPVPPEA